MALVISMWSILLLSAPPAFFSVSLPSVTVTMIFPSTERFVDVGVPLTARSFSTLTLYTLLK